MICTCGAFYIGKTIREFRQRMGDHFYDSDVGKLTTVGRHVGLYHRYDLSVVRFFILEVIPPHPQGGDCNHTTKIMSLD